MSRRTSTNGGGTLITSINQRASLLHAASLQATGGTPSSSSTLASLIPAHRVHAYQYGSLNPLHPAPDLDSITLSGASYASCHVLDLHDQAYNDLHILTAKFPGKSQQTNKTSSSSSSSSAYPWSILILSGNMLSRLDGLQRCIHLRKLDLSRNGIDTLPKGNFWRVLKSLQFLSLHQNKLDSIHAVQQLSVLPHLEILTLFGNPVEHHPAYRHILVNSCLSLRLLDFYIISDAELIEGAQWGRENKYATYAKTMECDILNIDAGVLPNSNNNTTANNTTTASFTDTTTSSIPTSYDINESSHLKLLSAQLEIVRIQHRRYSPILKIQALFRGILVRRTIRIYNDAARMIQAKWRKYLAGKMIKEQVKRMSMVGAGAGVGGVNGSHNHQSNTAGSTSLHLPPPSTTTLPHTISTSSLLTPTSLSTISSSHTIYLVHTSDIAVSLFLQLVKRVEASEGILATNLQQSNILLLMNQPNIKDDYPLVRRIYPYRDTKSKDLKRSSNSSGSGSKSIGCSLLPGKMCSPSIKRSLHLLRNRTAGRIFSHAQHVILTSRIQSRTYSQTHRFLMFQSPNARFHEILIRAIHAYNIEMGNYSSSSQDDTDTSLGVDGMPNSSRSIGGGTHRSHTSIGSQSGGGSMSEIKQRDELHSRWQLGVTNMSSGGMNTDGSASSSRSHTSSHTTPRSARRSILVNGGTSASSSSNATSKQSSNERKVIIYPGTTIHVICAAITIQSVFRSYSVRKWLQPCLGRRQVEKRAVVCLVRWWRNILFRHRLHLLTGLKRYGDSINSRHLFVRGDLLGLLKEENVPNKYVEKKFCMEHRSIFGIEPKDTTHGAAAGLLSSSATNPTALRSDYDTEPIGKATLFLDPSTTSTSSPEQIARFYAYPKWLAKHWQHQPMEVMLIQGQQQAGSSEGGGDPRVRSLSVRLRELILEGVHISILPDVSGGNNNQPQQQQQQQPPPPPSLLLDPTNNNNSQGWRAHNFIKLTFSSVEEARTRALLLALNTWQPEFHLLYRANNGGGGGGNGKLNGVSSITSATPSTQLPGSNMVLLMTPQHMTLCLQYQQAGGPSGPSGERYILYTTFWLSHFKNAPDALYTNQAYLDLQYQLKLVEEAHVAAERLETQKSEVALTLSGIKNKMNNSSMNGRNSLLNTNGNSVSSNQDELDSLQINGDRGISTYNPSVFTIKRELAESSRLLHRRYLAQSRITQHTVKLQHQEQAREQTVMHRIKMEHIAEREVEARRQRQLDYERLDAISRAARDRLLSSKHAFVHSLRNDELQRTRLRELDREYDVKLLRKRVVQEKGQTQKKLQERYEKDEAKMMERVEEKRGEKEKHKRLLEEKDSTLSFISAQNMISRQLTTGMRQRLSTHQTQKIQATVQARREMNHQRRHQVHQVLFENFNRRRQTALAQQLELKSHVQLRTIKDENKVNLMRARRQHLASVRALANSTAIATMNGGGMLQEMQHSIVQAGRPVSSQSSAAYAPNSSLRSASQLPPIRATSASALRQAGTTITSPTGLSGGGGDQLALQMNVLRDLADRIKLQYQTANGNQQQQMMQQQQNQHQQQQMQYRG